MLLLQSKFDDMKLKQLYLETKAVVDKNNYHVESQYAHPDRVSEADCEHAENSVEEYFASLSDAALMQYCIKTIKLVGEDDADIHAVLQTIANYEADTKDNESLVVTVTIP